MSSEEGQWLWSLMRKRMRTTQTPSRAVLKAEMASHRYMEVYRRTVSSYHEAQLAHRTIAVHRLTNPTPPLLYPSDSPANDLEKRWTTH
jgi:hypothetical protein